MTEQISISILVDRKTNRLLYTLRHVFEYRLNVRFNLFTNKDEFALSESFKLNYSSTKIEGVPHIYPSNILFEKRLQQPVVDVSFENELPLLFSNANREFGHDVFGAIFFLLSRYEEYFPFRKDEHERFASTHSLASKYDYLRRPLVDIYIIRIAEWLNKCFSVNAFKPVSGFKHLVTVDVDQIFKYKAKGLARTALGFASDALKNQSSFSQRASIVLAKKKDPNDVYDEFLDHLESKKLESIFFFQVGDSSRFDINNPVHLPRVKSRINELSIRTRIGIHPSYFSSDDFEIMQREFDRFNTVSSTKLHKSRQHYLRLKLPKTYRQLESLGVTDEYSMAFADANGFRAATCFPYQFYDLERDELTRMTIHPTAWLDITSVRKSSSLSESIKDLNDLMQEVKNVGGQLITVWHPEVLNGDDVPFASWPIFESLISAAE